MSPKPRLRARGVSTNRWAKWRYQQRKIVMERADGKCQACQGECYPVWHHAFGRGNIIAEPLASHALMCFALCDACHEDAHLDIQGRMNFQLRCTAMLRSLEAFGFEIPTVFEPVGMARSLERLLRDDGTWAALEIEARQSVTPYKP